MTSDGAQQRLEAGCPAWGPGSGYVHISTTELNELTADRGQLLIALDGAAGPGEKTHRYLSTACLHGAEPGREDLHRECQVDTRRYDGTHKVGATCKWCSARCICTCHAGPGEEGSDGHELP
jgi:hypothetical protein